jgi:AraC-like DNA-binding protein
MSIIDFYFQYIGTMSPTDNPTNMAKEPEYFSKQVTDARRWFLALPQPDEKSIVTVSVGCERCLPDYVVERTGFEFECIEFVAEGQGALSLNGEKHVLHPGSVFSYNPGIPHRIENTSASPMLKYFLDCGGQAAGPRFLESSIGGGKHAHVGDVAEIAEIFELLIRNARAESKFSQRVCAALVETLLLKISENTIAEATANTRAWTTCQRVRRHMEKHFVRLKSMAEVARETGIAPAYLSRVFRRFHGVTPYRFLMRLKMSHAASLLLNPDALVKEVAYELDFSDPFHFSRSFKSVYGVSPERFMNRGARR